MDHISGLKIDRAIPGVLICRSSMERLSLTLYIVGLVVFIVIVTIYVIY